MEGLKPLFPVPVYINQVDIKNIELPKFEDDDINVIQKEYPELKKVVFETITDILKVSGQVAQPLKLNDMWVNRYNEQRWFDDLQFRQNCSWTGCYFPVKPNHVITIYNPNAHVMEQHYPEITQFSEFSSSKYTFEAEKNVLMIFPSWIAQSSIWSYGEKGNKESYSISFDVKYELPIGNKDFGSYSE